MRRKSNKQISYWVEQRLGKSQIEIANQYNITKQAVSRGIQVQEYKVVGKLLEQASSMAALVEWHSGLYGFLIGIVPQLNNKEFLIMMNDDQTTSILFDNQDPNALLGFSIKFKQNLRIENFNPESFEDLKDYILKKLRRYEV